MSKALEIFKSGTHTDMHGQRLTFTDEDLDQIIADYDPAVFAAPLVVGHPKTDDPAYGWVGKLAKAGDILTVTETDKLETAFAESVNQGRWRKISAAFFPPKHPANPKPGGWYLRHVGFLGAAAPAIKGLRPAEFSEADDDLVIVEFSEADFESRWVLGRLARSLRDWLLEKFDAETADKVIPDYLAREAERAGDRRHASEPDTAFAAAPDPSTTQPNTQTPEDTTVDPNKEQEQQAAAFAERETALQTREQELAAKEQALAEQAATARKEGIAEFAEQLVKDGKVLPREKEGLVAFMEAQDDEAVVEFAEGDTTVKKPGSDWLNAFLEGLPARVDFAERGAATDDEGHRDASFAAPAGYSVDADQLAIHNKAVAYQAKHQCDYTTAINAVS